MSSITNMHICSINIYIELIIYNQENDI